MFDSIFGENDMRQEGGVFDFKVSHQALAVSDTDLKSQFICQLLQINSGAQNKPQIWIQHAQTPYNDCLIDKVY